MRQERQWVRRGLSLFRASIEAGVSSDAALEKRDEEQQAEGEREEDEGKCVGFGVVEFLNFVVERDAGDAGDTGDGAADHENDAEFAERVGEGERESGGDAASRERKMNAEPDAMRAGAEGAAGVDQLGRDGTQRGLKRLHGERERVDDGSDDETAEGECERRDAVLRSTQRTGGPRSGGWRWRGAAKQTEGAAVGRRANGVERGATAMVATARTRPVAKRATAQTCDGEV